ncbi:TPA: YiiX/YebB-like N1pC/P60 family cysteine hydrolase [Acinetobacter baumannii]
MFEVKSRMRDKFYNSLIEYNRNLAAADIFKIIGSEKESQELINRLKGFSDQQLNFLARLSNIPNEQINIYKDFVKGNDNEFTKEITKFDANKILRPGDIILMTGTSSQSKILVKAQKPFYLKAKSSHVAIVQSEIVCVDALPKVGVSMRPIMDVLSDVEPNWRVIRFNEINETYHDNILKACAFYVMQPYQIKPKKKPGKDFSYCSELARKIFLDLKLENTGIPNNTIVKPCNFDRLADNVNNWTDVTHEVRDFVEFCRKYDAIFRSMCKLQIDGIKLNQFRYKQRREILRSYKTRVSRGLLSQENYLEIKEEIQKIESNMNFQFWNFKKK